MKEGRGVLTRIRETMDTLNADLNRMRRINRTLGLLSAEQRREHGLKKVETLFIRPSRDLREVTRKHAGEIPWAVRTLLRSLGGWGRDWRMASYLLFDSAYCMELINLGYKDGLNARQDITDFLESG